MSYCALSQMCAYLCHDAWWWDVLFNEIELSVPISCVHLEYTLTFMPEIIRSWVARVPVGVEHLHIRA